MSSSSELWRKQKNLCHAFKNKRCLLSSCCYLAFINKIKWVNENMVLLNRPHESRSITLTHKRHGIFCKYMWHWPFPEFVRKVLQDLTGLSVVLHQRLHKRRQLTHLLHLRAHNRYFGVKPNTDIEASLRAFFTVSLLTFLSPHYTRIVRQNNFTCKALKSVMPGGTTRVNTKPNWFDRLAQMQVTVEKTLHVTRHTEHNM